MKHDWKHIIVTKDHRCPFCKKALAFYIKKESRRRVWFNCLVCGFSPRVKKLTAAQQEAEAKVEAEKIKKNQLKLM